MNKIKLYIKQYKKIIIPTLIFISIALSLIIIKVSIDKRNKNYIKTYTEESIIKEDIENETIEKEESNKEEKRLCHVDIKGAVKTPGVYVLEEGKRVKDVIELAGGLTENSDTTLINLAKTIFDEMIIVIYSKEEVNETNKKFELNTRINDAYQENTESSKNDSTTSTSSNNDTVGIININTATLEELMTLSGIGETKAQAIISYRQENGNFTTIEDIMNVSGIGQSTYEKIKNNITV